MDTIGRQPHIVLRVQGEADAHFSLIPIITSEAQIIAKRVLDIAPLGGLAEASFRDGYPVFFEGPEDTIEGKYQFFNGRPDIHWPHFKHTDHIRQVLHRNNRDWQVQWRALHNSSQFETVAIPVTVLVAMVNSYLKPLVPPCYGLADGTPLYPAFFPLQVGERHRRAMRYWDGASGEWVGVTLDGRLFQQPMYWGGERPCRSKWQQFTMA